MLQQASQLVHNTTAPITVGAQHYSTNHGWCTMLQHSSRLMHSTHHAWYTILQHSSQLVHSTTAPIMVDAQYYSSQLGRCTTLQHSSRLVHNITPPIGLVHNTTAHITVGAQHYSSPQHVRTDRAGSCSIRSKIIDRGCLQILNFGISLFSEPAFFIFFFNLIFDYSIINGLLVSAEHKHTC